MSVSQNSVNVSKKSNHNHRSSSSCTSSTDSDLYYDYSSVQESKSSSYCSCRKAHAIENPLNNNVPYFITTLLDCPKCIQRKKEKQEFIARKKAAEKGEKIAELHNLNDVTKQQRKLPWNIKDDNNDDFEWRCRFFDEDDLRVGTEERGEKYTNSLPLVAPKYEMSKKGEEEQKEILSAFEERVQDEILELKIDYMIKKKAAQVDHSEDEDEDNENENDDYDDQYKKKSRKIAFVEDCEMVGAVFRVIKSLVLESTVLAPKQTHVRFKQLHKVQQMLKQARQWNHKDHPRMPMVDLLGQFCEVLLLKRSIPRFIFVDSSTTNTDETSSLPLSQEGNDDTTGTTSKKSEQKGDSSSTKESPSSLSSLQSLELKFFKYVKRMHENVELLKGAHTVVEANHEKHLNYRKKLRRSAKRRRIEKCNKDEVAFHTNNQLQYDFIKDILHIATAMIEQNQILKIDRETRRMQLEILHPLMKCFKIVPDMQSALTIFMNFISFGNYTEY